MNIEEHKKTHEELHKRLDELLADYITHNPNKLPSNTTCMELLKWSHEQTLVPTGD